MRHCSRYRMVAALSLMYALFCARIGGAAQVTELDKLNVCYSSIAATSITTWVPQEAGIFKKYGLDVNVIYVADARMFFDPAPLEQLIKEGFVKELYPR